MNEAATSLPRPWSARWWRERSLAKAHAAIDPDLWPAAFAALPLLDGLTADETARIKDLAVLFLRRKAVELARGAEIDAQTLLELALQAALPVLHLGLDWYQGWHALILYPDEFVPAREVIDEDGLVWLDDEPKSGEAWEQGPVILSLADATAGRARDGYNVVIHEMAHKLDMRSGVANGHPPLHRDMRDTAWAEAFTTAYDDLCRRADAGPAAADALPIDPYATESPAEFFAVISETFFELPQVLINEYPAVYDQLGRFYRQDPAERLRV